jgi:hypothetical protein
VTLKERLEAVASHVKEGHTPTATVRELLGWHSAYRRGYWIVRDIRSALEAAGLKTEPDFESTYIDAEVKFVPAENVPAEVPAAAPTPEAAPATVAAPEAVGRAS